MQIPPEWQVEHQQPLEQGRIPIIKTYTCGSLGACLLEGCAVNSVKIQAFEQYKGVNKYKNNEIK